VDGEQRVAVVVGAAQHVLHLERLELPRDGIGFLLEGPALEHLGDEARVLFVGLPADSSAVRARRRSASAPRGTDRSSASAP